MSPTMSSIDETSPPGVLMDMRTNEAPRRSRRLERLVERSAP